MMRDLIRQLKEEEFNAKVIAPIESTFGVEVHMNVYRYGDLVFHVDNPRNHTRWAKRIPLYDIPNDLLAPLFLEREILSAVEELLRLGMGENYHIHIHKERKR